MHIKTNYKTIFKIWVALMFILSYSFYTETIHSVFINKHYLAGIIGTLAFIILILGVSIFAYGGYLFLLFTVKLFKENEKLMENIAALKSIDTSREMKNIIRKENFQLLIQTWKPTFIYFGLAVLLIVICGITINISDGTINLMY